MGAAAEFLNARRSTAGCRIAFLAVTGRRVGAILLEQNDDYAIQNRYMNRESLATISDNAAIRLPAIAGP